MLDGNSRQNLATFCQTWEESEIHQLMDTCIDKNMVDKDEYPQTAEIESRCVRMLGDLWHAPAPEHTAGCSTTGSSEAAMLAGLAMKRRWERAARPEASRLTSPISSLARCRSAGTSSPVTGTPSIARFRWKRGDC